MKAYTIMKEQPDWTDGAVLREKLGMRYLLALALFGDDPTDERASDLMEAFETWAEGTAPAARHELEEALRRVVTHIVVLAASDPSTGMEPSS